MQFAWARGLQGWTGEGEPYLARERQQAPFGYTTQSQSTVQTDALSPRRLARENSEEVCVERQVEIVVI